LDRRHYKRAITIEKAREWLDRVEEQDETPPQISKTDFVDVRTVRKQIARAREEREQRATRQSVLKSAMEKHYTDLVSLAKKMKTALLKDTPVSLPSDLRESPLLRALREHLPRARLWKAIDQLQVLETEYRKTVSTLKETIALEVKQKTSLEFVISAGEYGLYDGFTEAMFFYLFGLTLGWHNFDLIDYKDVESASGVRIERGAYGLGFVPADKVHSVKSAFDGMMDEASGWKEYAALSHIMGEFATIKAKIEDELLKIILRRVVPGKCVYCPF
jgi:hypothetical protein